MPTWSAVSSDCAADEFTGRPRSFRCKGSCFSHPGRNLRSFSDAFTTDIFSLCVRFLTTRVDSESLNNLPSSGESKQMCTLLQSSAKYRMKLHEMSFRDAGDMVLLP